MLYDEGVQTRWEKNDPQRNWTEGYINVIMGLPSRDVWIYGFPFFGSLF